MLLGHQRQVSRGCMERTEGPELERNEMSEDSDRTGISERKGREKARLTAKP